VTISIVAAWLGGWQLVNALLAILTNLKTAIASRRTNAKTNAQSKQSASVKSCSKYLSCNSAWAFALRGGSQRAEAADAASVVIE
jgi:hypothetical protein